MKAPSLWTPALIGAAMCTLAASAGAQTFAGPGGVIPAVGTGGGTYSAGAPCTSAVGSFFTSSVVVPVAVTSVDQIQLNISVTHTWVGDLQIVLIDPLGGGHNIMVRPGFNSAGAFGNSGDRLLGDYKFVKAGAGGLPVPHAAATPMPPGVYTEDFGDPAGALPGGIWVGGNTIDGAAVANGMGSVGAFAPGGTWKLNIYDWAGGDAGASGSWSISVNGPKPPPPVTYCVGKVHSAFCTPSIGSSGIASAAAGSGFTVNCSLVLNNKSGLLFYSVTGPAATAFQCGTLCMMTPIRRTPAQGSGGTAPPAADCSGAWAIDMNCFAVGACGGVPIPALTVPSTSVWCQWWGRDPGFAAPCNTQLSNGLNYIIGP
jgi:subtilisin-like proprotein convertase family protein